MVLVARVVKDDTVPAFVVGAVAAAEEVPEARAALVAGVATTVDPTVELLTEGTAGDDTAPEQFPGAEIVSLIRVTAALRA